MDEGKSCYGDYDGSDRVCMWMCKQWFDCKQIASTSDKNELPINTDKEVNNEM